MPTYVYETVSAGRKPKRFEIRQSIRDHALTEHPDTGEPVRRVVSGGAGILTSKSAPSHPAPRAAGHGCCCGAGGCGH